MNPFKNVHLSLSAVGPAAVIAILVISIAAVGIFGEGPVADRAMGALIGLGAMIIGYMAAKIR